MAILMIFLFAGFKPVSWSMTFHALDCRSLVAGREYQANSGKSRTSWKHGQANIS